MQPTSPWKHLVRIAPCAQKESFSMKLLALVKIQTLSRLLYTFFQKGASPFVQVVVASQSAERGELCVNVETTPLCNSGGTRSGRRGANDLAQQCSEQVRNH